MMFAHEFYDLSDLGDCWTLDNYEEVYSQNFKYVMF